MNNSDLFIKPERCCLFVIDPQERLMAAIYKADLVISNTQMLIHCAKTLNIPIISSTQYVKGLGPFVPELDKVLKDYPCEDKTEFNGLANPNVRRLLDDLPKTVDTLLLAGAEAHICIYQTALGIMQAGYKPWIVADAVSSREKRNAELALQRLQALGMSVGPTEMVIYELLYKAGTKEFKAMLPFMK